MKSLADAVTNALSNALGFTPPLPATHAAWPIWSGSTTKKTTYQPMPRSLRKRVWFHARDYDKKTRRKGCRGGQIGYSGLQVLEALLFGYLNCETGRLDPSYAAIARKAGVCVRTVAAVVKRLRALGILARVRRCLENWQDGRFRLVQRTNAYAVLPATQWLGYTPPPESPPPAPGTWGDPARMPDALTEAMIEQRTTGDPASVLRVLEINAMSELEKALASLDRARLDAARLKDGSP